MKGLVIKEAIFSGNVGILRNFIDFPVISEILSATSGKEYAIGPVRRNRFPDKSFLMTVCAQISPKSIGEIVGRAGGPPPGTINVFPRIIEKKISMEGAAPKTVQLKSDLIKNSSIFCLINDWGIENFLTNSSKIS